MKTYILKSSFIVTCLLLFFSCSQGEIDGITTSTNPVNTGVSTEHFYGMAYPEVIGSTRGVAQRENLWYPCSTIKVKFLNDPYNMATKIKTYAAEWEQHAGIHFNFVESGDAHVRIGFDWNDERYITWSYIGTDCKMVTNQNEATMSFAYWDSSTEQEMKGDVLRAFGQVLGLELEHRHLEFDAGWTNRIADYWEGEIEDIPWENLQKYVFTPLERGGSTLQTPEYDEESIMIWPFSSRYAKNTARGFNYELSQKDKEFIAGIYPKCEEESVVDTLLSEKIDFGVRYDFYVDAPGNLYGVYGKGYFDLFLLNNEFIPISYGIGLDWDSPHLNWPYYKHTFGFCKDIADTYYCITVGNQLLALSNGNNPINISGRFPANTIFLALTPSHDSSDIYISTATGDGSNNYRQGYSSQKIYKFSVSNYNVTEVVSNVNIPPVFHSDYIRVDSTTSDSPVMLFPYTSVISKSKGSFVYGLGADGRYFKANVVTDDVAYYTPRTPVQFLVGGTSRTNPVALSGRQILELRPDQDTDRIIGYLPDSIGDPLLFLSNADQTIFYISTFEIREANGLFYEELYTYRLKVND